MKEGTPVEAETRKLFMVSWSVWLTTASSVWMFTANDVLWWCQNHKICYHSPVTAVQQLHARFAGLFFQHSRTSSQSDDVTTSDAKQHRLLSCNYNHKKLTQAWLFCPSLAVRPSVGNVSSGYSFYAPVFRVLHHKRRLVAPSSRQLRCWKQGQR